MSSRMIKPCVCIFALIVFLHGSASAALLQQEEKTAKSAASEDSQSDVQDSVRQLMEKSRSSIERFDLSKLPKDTPNWVYLHSLLYSDLSTASNKRKVDQRLAPEPGRAKPLFIARRNLPTPNPYGERFDIEQHRDQFLHILSMADISVDESLSVNGKKFVVGDLVKYSKFQVVDSDELSWTLSAYSHYSPTQKWNNKFGDEFSVARLVKQLIEKENTACGDTHKFLALARASKVLGKNNRALKAEVDGYLRKKIEILKDSQLRDGSFGLAKQMADQLRISRTEFDSTTGIHYTGHSLEWLGVFLSRDELKAGWILDSIKYLDFAIEKSYSVEEALEFDSDKKCENFGDLAHALSALKIVTTKVENP